MGEEGEEGNEGEKMGRGEWFVHGRGYLPDRRSGAYCLVQVEGEKKRGWGEEWFPGIAQKNKRKRAGGKQLVVKHRGKYAGNGSGESVLLINKLN